MTPKTACVACGGELTAHDRNCGCIRCGACRFNGNGVKKAKPAERAKIWPWGWNQRKAPPSGPVTWWIGLGRPEFFAEVRGRFVTTPQNPREIDEDP